MRVDPKPTGLGRYSLNVTKQMLKDPRFEYYVLTSMPQLFEIDSNQIITAPSWTQPGFGKYGAVNRFIFTLLLKYRRKIDFNLVYTPSQHGFPNLNNQVITIHDLLPLKFKEAFSKQSLSYYHYRFIIPKLLKLSQKVIAVSVNTKNDIVNYYGLSPSSIRVVYNGVDVIADREFLSKDKLMNKFKLSSEYILSVGTSSFRYKNAERLIIAFAKQHALKEYNLVFCGGRPDYISLLKHLATKFNAQERIIFLDYVNEKELFSLYKWARLFVYPSLYEGFGLPPLESMACGCPVIVSNTSSLPEVCGDAAFYVDPNSVEDIERGMEKVLNDKELQTKLIINGFERVKQFSWNKTAQGILNVFEEVLEER